MKRYARCLLVGLLFGCGTGLQDATGPASIHQGAAAATSVALEAAAPDHGEATSVACDFGGPWVLELGIPVRWEANAQVAAGAGKVRLRATSLRKVAGNLLIDGLTPCAIALPTTERKSGARVRTKFSMKAFAEGAHTITPALTSIRASEPGARFGMQPFALQYGAIIANATMAPWPEDVAGNAVDVDGDGHPGVTVKVATTEQAMAQDPVAHLYMAWRVVISTAGGRLETCDAFKGQGVVPSLGQQMAVNVSVLGCSKRSGANCSPAEVEMASAWLPTYQHDGHASMRMTRVAEDTPGACPAF